MFCYHEEDRNRCLLGWAWVVFVCFILVRDSLASLELSYTDKTGLKLRDPLLSASLVLGSKVYDNMFSMASLFPL